MRTALFGLAVNVAALLACGAGPGFERGRGGMVAVRCGRDLSECYNSAAEACPYGYETVNDSIKGQLAIKCEKPTFCEDKRCDSEFRCRTSERKGIEGRKVCVLR